MKDSDEALRDMARGEAAREEAREAPLLPALPPAAASACRGFTKLLPEPAGLARPLLLPLLLEAALSPLPRRSRPPSPPPPLPRGLTSCCLCLAAAAAALRRCCCTYAKAHSAASSSAAPALAPK